MNGSLVGRNTPQDITPGTTAHDSSSDNNVDTLTVFARPDYNGTEVICVARFDDGRPDEQTDPAMLTGTCIICTLGTV